MKELLEYIIKSIVNDPDSVQIEDKESVDFPGLTILSVNVSESDKGIIIGKRGRTINAIRDIMSINAIRSNKRVRIVVEENRDKEVEVKENVEKTSEPTVSIDEQDDIFSDDI